MAQPLSLYDRLLLLDTVDDVMNVFGIAQEDYLMELAEWLLDEARIEPYLERSLLMKSAAESLQYAAGALGEAAIVRDFNDDLRNQE